MTNSKIDHKCIKCGNHEKGSWGDDTNKQMLELKFCFSCHFWWTKVQMKDHRKVVRIDSVHYFIGENNNNPSKWKGYSGSKFNVKFKNGRIVETDNLWHNGDIPKEWKDQLPDNAEFIRNIGEIVADKLNV